RGGIRGVKPPVNHGGNVQVNQKPNPSASSSTSSSPSEGREMNPPATPSSPEPASPASGAVTKRPRRQPSGPHPEAVAYFCDAWRAKYGDRYPFNGGKDGAAVKWMLADLDNDPDRWRGVVDAYLVDATDYITQARHTLGVLRSSFARFKVAPRPGNGRYHGIMEWLRSRQEDHTDGHQPA